MPPIETAAATIAGQLGALMVCFLPQLIDPHF
jgi:hypothetical protein